jgi:aminopeptidase-like protein
LDWDRAGAEMHALAARLFPICRSITGPGLRDTLKILQESIPLELTEVPSGSDAFDWTVPKEWTIREAWIKGPQGETVVDFKRNNLHVMGYSVPVRARMRLSDLRAHLHTLPEHPDWIPYRTSYYKEAWGFCLAQRQLDGLPDGEYEVCIDSTLADGGLTYAECVLPGASRDEILLFCHVCHPSLANDNLSGMAVAERLARLLGQVERRHTFRFVFAPTVIGSIVWLSRNEEKAKRIKHGLTLALLGDPGQVQYKQTRAGNAPIDRAIGHVLRHSGKPHVIRPFTPYGYDERQFNSPGFALPVGCLMRSPNGTFPQYHNSGDDLGFIRPEALADSLRVAAEALAVLEGDGAFLNLNPKCEPRLGKRGIYDGLKGKSALGDTELALLWILNQSDGAHSLLDIAERAGMPFATVRRAADALEGCGLLAPAAAGGVGTAGAISA